MENNTPDPPQKPPIRGRGTAARPDGRFEQWQRAAFDDGWTAEEEATVPKTELIVDTARSVIVEARSPDIPFELSINPYRGCEHGCSYCFARPTHSYLGYSPGLDFETKILWKPDAPEILRKELARPGYRCRPIALGINTDGWQPVERKLGLTRQLLEVLCETRHPVSIVTKSALIERDIDLLADMARDNLVQVMFSITTLDRELARKMEPRAATPARRLAAMKSLHQAGIPVGVLFAPLIPALNDHELEAVLEASRAAGAETAGYALLRLPHELKALFATWLQQHVPGRAAHVLSLLRQMHGGKLYDSRFGQRMRGDGAFADLYRHRFALARQRTGFEDRVRPLNLAAFRPPRLPSAQADLFD